MPTCLGLYIEDKLIKYAKVSKEKEKVKNAIFSIIFVEDEEIHQINKEYRNVDRITDVISFAFEDSGELLYNDIRMLGDIYICIPQMKRQAINYEHSEIKLVSERSIVWKTEPSE